ncbi:hypothetical protein [Coraliomargarita akajimensis]|nr:hypothetical protein [Coraliomargarita akajimensis]
MLKSSSEKIANQYRIIAEKYQLELTIPESKMGGFMRPEPFVHGHHKGRELSISAPGKGLQNTRQSETVLKIEIRDQQMRLQLTEKGLFSKMQQRDSGLKTPWVSGDPAFDASFDVRTNDGVRLAMLLGEDGLREFQRVFKGSKAMLYIRNGVIAVSVLGLMADDKSRTFIEDAIRLLCDFAEFDEG